VKFFYEGGCHQVRVRVRSVQHVARLRTRFGCWKGRVVLEGRKSIIKRIISGGLFVTRIWY